MGKRLVIAEKPSVARDIAQSLGGFEDHGGEFFESEDLVVTWAVGHLLQLAEPKEYDKAFSSWSIKNLPIIPAEYKLQPRDGQKKRLDLIKRLTNRKDVDSLINGCDAGREGEMIFRRIYEYTGSEKSVERLWLQSMTEEAIRRGFDQLRPGSELDPLGDAAWCRSVGDWLIGMNATRALTQRLKSRGEQGAWSAGRVQTPTLNLLVLREREILAHESEPYWEINARFGYAGAEWDGRFWDPEHSKDEDPQAKPNRVFDRARVDALLAGLAQAKTGIAGEKRKKSKQSPPLMFDLTLLQREMNRRSSLSAKRTLDAAQRLYEQHKLITYPRTDSRHLPEDYGETVHKVLQNLTAAEGFGQIATDILAKGPKNLDKILDSSKVSDHFAIVPTGDLPKTELTGDDARVYDLVVRQFLASMMEPAVWSSVERIVEVEAGAEVAKFRTTARSLEFAGFLEALGREAGSGTDLPPLVPGEDQVDGVGVDLLAAADDEKETKAPPRYSEAQLLRMMETAGQLLEEDELSDAMRDRGLGTPATRADTIEGLIRKQYARRVEGKLAPTSKAMRLMDVLTRVEVQALASPALTGEWEYQLQEVQAGRLGRDALLTRLEDYTREVISNLVGFDHETLYASEPPLGSCPACGEGQVTESAWGYPCNRNTGPKSDCNFIIWKDRAGRYIDRKTAAALLRERKIGPISGFVDRYGRVLTGTVTLLEDPEKKRWVLHTEFGQPVDGDQKEEIRSTPWKCPVHEDCDILETNLRYACRKLVDGEVIKGAPILPKMVCHREITVDEAAPFFTEDGKTPLMDGFISKRGRPFRGMLFRKPTGKHGFEFPPREPKVKKEGAEAGAKKPAAKKPAAKKPAAKKTATTTAAAKKPAAKKATTAAAKKPAAKKPAAKKPAAAEASPEVPAAKKPAAKKPAAKKPAARKPAAAKDTETATRKPAAKKPAAKKPAARKPAAKKPAAAREASSGEASTDDPHVEA